MWGSFGQFRYSKYLQFQFFLLQMLHICLSAKNYYFILKYIFWNISKKNIFWSYDCLMANCEGEGERDLLSLNFGGKYFWQIGPKFGQIKTEIHYSTTKMSIKLSTKTKFLFRLIWLQFGQVYIIIFLHRLGMDYGGHKVVSNFNFDPIGICYKSNATNPNILHYITMKRDLNHDDCHEIVYKLSENCFCWCLLTIIYTWTIILKVWFQVSEVQVCSRCFSLKCIKGNWSNFKCLEAPLRVELKTWGLGYLICAWHNPCSGG